MGIFTAKSQPKYSSIRRKRKLRTMTSVDISSIPGSKNMFLGVVVVCMFTLVIFFSLQILTSDYFRVRTITTIGVRTVSSQQITEDIEGLTTEGIFLTNSSSVERTLVEKYPSFKSISVSKVWPDRLIINVTEKQPALFYVNLNGVYLVNEDGVISEVIFQDKINFAQEQLNIITGAEGIDSTLVYERLKSDYLQKKEEEKSKNEVIEDNRKKQDIEEEQKTDFDFSQVSQDQKFVTLDIIRGELFDQAKIIIVSYLEKFDSSSYPPLEKVFVFDNSVYKEGDFIDQDRLGITRELLRFFSQNGTVVKEIFWEGKFMVRVIMDNNKTIVFGIGRNISEQLEDLLIITRELEKEEKNYHEIDLSSRKVSVK